MRVTLDSFMPFRLSGTRTDTPLQTAPSSDPSNPTLLRAKKKKEKKHTHLCLNTHQQQAHNTNTPPRKWGEKKKSKKKQQKNREAQTFRQTGTRHKAERRHTRTHLPDTRRKLTDKHTKRRAQSTAQPEVYFMQEYSKVNFTIQLNIKDGYIPL